MEIYILKVYNYLTNNISWPLHFHDVKVAPVGRKKFLHKYFTLSNAPGEGLCFNLLKINRVIIFSILG